MWYPAPMRYIPPILCLLATQGTAQSKTVDCYCTDQGGARIELGETICLHVNGRSFLAQCQMSLNSPMWRETQEGCYTSRAPDLMERLQGLKPA